MYSGHGTRDSGLLLMKRSHSYKRADRVSELVRHEISTILLRDVKDPRIETVTVTRVKITDDLRSARVYFGVLNKTTQVEEIESALQQASSFIHKLMARRLRLKNTPKLVFEFDRNLDYSYRISEILQSIGDEEE